MTPEGVLGESDRSGVVDNVGRDRESFTHEHSDIDSVPVEVGCLDHRPIGSYDTRRRDTDPKNLLASGTEEPFDEVVERIDRGGATTTSALDGHGFDHPASQREDRPLPAASVEADGHQVVRIVPDGQQRWWFPST